MCHAGRYKKFASHISQGVLFKDKTKEKKKTLYSFKSTPAGIKTSPPFMGGIEGRVVSGCGKKPASGASAAQPALKALETPQFFC